LVAALAAHAVLFGGEHAMGGGSNGAFVEGALSALAGLGTFAGLLLFGTRNAADGTILVARLSSALPGTASLAISAAGWFALGEHLEPAHAGFSAIAVAVVLLTVSVVVTLLAKAALRLLAAVVFAISRALQLCHPEPGRVLRASMRSATLAPSWRIVEGRGPRPPPVNANA
jgi:hypothetical protein